MKMDYKISLRIDISEPTLKAITQAYLQILPMLMFGEAFLNGAGITLAVAYKPQWVATFHDRWYLQGK